MEREILAIHKGENCPQRIVTCDFCEFPLPAVDLAEHQVITLFLLTWRIYLRVFTLTATQVSMCALQFAYRKYVGIGQNFVPFVTDI